MSSLAGTCEEQGRKSNDLVVGKGSTMFATLLLPEGWRAVVTPPSLFRRFEFNCYRDTRAFLEHLAALSEETGLYPDLGFGTTHVNVTLYGAGGRSPGTNEVDFASRASTLASPG